MTIYLCFSQSNDCWQISNSWSEDILFYRLNLVEFAFCGFEILTEINRNSPNLSTESFRFFLLFVIFGDFFVVNIIDTFIR